MFHDFAVDSALLLTCLSTFSSNRLEVRQQQCMSESSSLVWGDVSIDSLPATISGRKIIHSSAVRSFGTRDAYARSAPGQVHSVYSVLEACGRGGGGITSISVTSLVGRVQACPPPDVASRLEERTGLVLAELGCIRQKISRLEP